MKVIILKDTAGLGRKFDVKNVSDGYAINKLIPQGLVREASLGALKQAETERAKIESERKVHEDLLAKNLEGIEGKTIHISAKANEQGHLFANIHADAIVKQLKDELRVQAHADFLTLPDHIKTLGEHVIGVEAGGKKVKFTLVVEAVQ